MKTTMLTVLIAGIALWGGFTVGYHYGSSDTVVKLHPRYPVTEVTTYSGRALNRAPQGIVLTNNAVGTNSSVWLTKRN